MMKTEIKMVQKPEEVHCRRDALHYLRVWPLPASLALEERRALLQDLFGAAHVLHATRRGKNNAALAGYNSAADCRYAVSRLHQLQLLGNTLTAVIAHNCKQGEEMVTEQQLGRLQQLDADLTTHLSPAPHLRYKYPAPSATIIANISNALVAVPKLYTQVLHLMNKMNLPLPFGTLLNNTEIVKEALSLTKAAVEGRPVDYSSIEDNGSDKIISTLVIPSVDHFKDRPTTNILCNRCKLRSVESDEIKTISDVTVSDNEQETLHHHTTSESELESEEDSDIDKNDLCSLSVKQIQSMKRPRKIVNSSSVDVRKRAKLQLQQEKATLRFDQSTYSGNSMKRDESQLVKKMFKGTKELGSSGKMLLNIPSTVCKTSIDTSTIMKGREIAEKRSPSTVKVLPSDSTVTSLEVTTHGTTAATPASTCASRDTTTDATSGFGMLAVKKTTEAASKTATSKYISLEELENNTVKESEYAVVPVLAKYSPGEPSARLYIKNLAKSVTVQHLRYLYDRYAHQYYRETGQSMLSDVYADTQRYHIRVLQEGRMKGQAFVTLPSVELAQAARKHTNGYILADKPMVVCFAKAKSS